MPVPPRAFTLSPLAHSSGRRLVLMAVALVLLGVGRADADTITLAASFVASGFRDGAPVDPVTGSYSVTFDNDRYIVEQTTGITLSNLNIAIDGPPAFFYDRTTDLLILGSTFNGLLTVFRDTNDFFLSIGHASTTPINVQMVYAQRGSDIFIGGATLKRIPVPVPEPSTLALVLAGAIAASLCVLMRRATDHTGALRRATHRSTREATQSQKPNAWSRTPPATRRVCPRCAAGATRKGQNWPNIPRNGQLDVIRALVQ